MLSMLLEPQYGFLLSNLKLMRDITNSSRCKDEIAMTHYMIEFCSV